VLTPNSQKRRPSIGGSKVKTSKTASSLKTLTKQTTQAITSPDNVARTKELEATATKAGVKAKADPEARATKATECTSREPLTRFSKIETESMRSSTRFNP
jgi:hypothetical protein